MQKPIDDSVDYVEKPLHCPCAMNTKEKALIQAVKDVLAGFQLNIEQLNSVTEIFQNGILDELRCRAENNTITTEPPPTNTKFQYSFLQNLPVYWKRERDYFVGVELTGTIIRTSFMHIKDRGMYDEDCRTFRLPIRLTTGTTIQLFDYIAKCLNEFLFDFKLPADRQYQLVLIFSFPLKQYSLTCAALMRWTKNFNIPDTINTEIIAHLKQSLTKYPRIRVNVAAIVNNTLISLMTCALKYPAVRIGLQIGYNCNISYMEKSYNLPTSNYINRQKIYVMLYSNELGKFCDTERLFWQKLRTEYDRFIDKNSQLPNQNLFGKLVSGRYLGEIVRLIILDCMKKKLLFKHGCSELLEKPNSFSIRYVHKIINSDPESNSNLLDIFEMFYLNKRATATDCTNVRYICETVVRRSADLVAAMLAAFINRINENRIVLAGNGSIYRDSSIYHNHLMGRLRELVDDDKIFHIVQPDDMPTRGPIAVLSSLH